MLLRRTVTNLDALERIEVGLQLLIVKFPLAGLLLCGNSIKICENAACGTLSTDGIRVKYNPAYILEVYGMEGDDGSVFRLAHEYLHVYLGHVPRRGDRDPRAWNMVGDLIINNMLKGVLGMPIPPGGISDIKGVTADNVEDAYDQYMALESKPPPDVVPPIAAPSDEEDDDSGDDEDDAESGNESGGEDSTPAESEATTGDEDGEDGEDDEDDESRGASRGYTMDLEEPAAGLEEHLADLTDEVQTVTALLKKINPQTITSLPAGLRARLEELNQPNAVPWTRLVLGEILRCIPGETPDWLDPKKSLYPRIFIPKMKTKDAATLVLAIDGSASVEQEHHRMFQSSVRPAIRKAKETHLLSFDERVTERLIIRHPHQLEEFKYEQGQHGYTSALEVFEYCDNLSTKPSVLVIETDGYVKHPDTPPSYKVVWVLTANGRELPWGVNYRMRSPWS